MNFKEKVQSMKFSEIMQAMIDGLTKEYVKVDMTVYGNIINNECYGCAATNAICEISGKAFTTDNVETTLGRSEFIETDYDFLSQFEDSVDRLRRTFGDSYNRKANLIDISNIPLEFINEIDKLPVLCTEYYKVNLPEWQIVCNQIKKAGY